MCCPPIHVSNCALVAHPIFNNTSPLQFSSVFCTCNTSLAYDQTISWNSTAELLVEMKKWTYCILIHIRSKNSSGCQLQNFNFWLLTLVLIRFTKRVSSCLSAFNQSWFRDLCFTGYFVNTISCPKKLVGSVQEKWKILVILSSNDFYRGAAH